MGSIKNGVLGGFAGKIGSVVGYQVGDDFYIRSKPVRRTAFTEKELLNQTKFKLVQDFLSPIKGLIKVGFQNYYTKTGGFRAAVAYTRKHALVTDDEVFYLDPALVKISGGELLPAINPSVILTANNQLTVTWDATEVNRLNEADQLMLLVYDTVNFKADYRIYNGGFRKDGQLTISIDPQMRNNNVEVYIAFVAADRSAQSDSQYLRQFMLS